MLHRPLAQDYVTFDMQNGLFMFVHLKFCPAHINEHNLTSLLVLVQITLLDDCSHFLY